MAFCSKCGTKLDGVENFCGSCGNKVKSSGNGKVTPTTKNNRNKGKQKFPKLLIILLFIGTYVILDYWALQQVELDTSFESILSSVANANVDGDVLTPSIESDISLKNPTFVPVFMTATEMRSTYGGTEFARGGTGILFIMPYSTSRVPMYIEISTLGTGISALKGIAGFITGQQQKLAISYYAKLGFMDVRLK